MGYRAEQVVNGTFAQVFVDGTEVAEAMSVKAEVEIETADINVLNNMAKQKKDISYEGKGELKLNKVTSRFIKLISGNLKQGKSTIVQILVKVADPDSKGTERILIKDAKLGKLTLVDVEGKKITEETIPFSFTAWELIDTI